MLLLLIPPRGPSPSPVQSVALPKQPSVEGPFVVMRRFTCWTLNLIRGANARGCRDSFPGFMIMMLRAVVLLGSVVGLQSMIGHTVMGLLCAQEVTAVGGAAGSSQSAGATADRAITAEWTEVVRPVLLKHCGECHMNGGNEGGVGFDDYDSLDKIRAHESTWEQIRGVIRAEAMPPPESATITPEERKVLTLWIERALHEVDCGCRPVPPSVTVRRLNQFEYDNTIRDLFGMELRPSKEIGFVSDDVGNGFDNQGEVLTLPPIAMEKYLQAAQWVSERVIATDREKFRKQSFDGENLAFSQRLKIPINLAAGKYSVSVRARFGDDQKDNCKARLLLDDQVIAEWDVPTKDETLKQEFEASPGDHVLIVEYSDDAEPEMRNAPNRRLNIESVRLVGPEGGEPAFPKSHQQLVIATPASQDAPESQPIGFTEATRRIFHNLLPRAYRRPVGDEELHAVMMVCQNANDSGYGFEESVRVGVQAVLVAPQFLFRTEKRIESVDHWQLDDFSIASRLSYFLWASMPDNELLELAAAGQLKDEAICNQQVARMLADSKAESLLSGFFAQWLGLRNLSKIDIDRDKYPFWSDRLRTAMIRETEMFCREMMRDGKIRDLLDGGHTYVNPRLAEFYGVTFEDKDPASMYRRRPGSKGQDPRRQGLYNDEDKWIRVMLPENRRGLMTQAAVLALTSNPTRSSPVKRGKWILETILGDPPPSAPPNVPSLEQAKAEASASLRERLEIHRSNPSCAGCHKLMDPIGLGLENFDAIGRWRDKEGELAIAPQGELADGRAFSGPTELVEILSQREDSVAKNFTERLLTYALGRGLQRPDRCDVDKILERSKQNGYTIKSIVEGIAESDAFLQRSVGPNSQ